MPFAGFALDSLAPGKPAHGDVSGQAGIGPSWRPQDRSDGMSDNPILVPRDPSEA